tara:strand:- start:13281 stop:13694 length:414 start_codon:yes stop_codon:yes gene_type:complete
MRTTRKRIGLLGYILAFIAWPLAVFTKYLTLDGTYEGIAQLVVSADSSGMLTDVFQESYPHPDFGKMAEEAISKWIFRPAKLNGEPITSIKPNAFKFEDNGGVYSIGFYEMAAAKLNFGSSINSKIVYSLQGLDTPL